MLAYLAENGVPLIVYAIGFVLTALVPDWRVFRIAATIVVLALGWTFLSLFQMVPPQVTNLVVVAAIAPGLIGAAGGLVVRAYQLQQPDITVRTRVITAAVGLLIFGLVAYFAGIG